MKSIISDPKSFHKLFNIIKDIVFIIDDRGRFLKANNTAIERLGYSEKEILDMHVPDMHPQDKYHEVLWLLEGILKGNTNKCRIPLLTKSKDIILVESTIEKLDQDANGLNYFLCISKVLSDIECENLRLKENESRWHFALENAGEGVWDWNIQTNEVFYSAQWKKMLGYTNEDIHKNIQEWQSRIHPDEKEWFENVLKNYLSGLTFKYENKYRIKTKSNDFIWVLDRGKVVEWTTENKPLRMVGIHSDISEIMNSERLIQISNQKLKDYLDNSPFGICIADQTGKYLDVNPKAAEMTGYSYDELLNLNLIDLIADEDKADTFKNFGILKQNGTISQEMQYLTKRNEKRYWKVTAVKLPNNTYLGYTEDITERKILESELKESAERYKSLHNASFGGIAIHDKGRILECNQGLSDMTGYSLEELIGMDGLLLIAPEHREMVMNKIVTGYEKPYEANGLRKNGDIFPMRLEARNVPYKGKNARTVEFRDITENKEAEKAIKDRENLLNRVFELLPIGLWFADANGKLIRGNPAGVKIWGAEPTVSIEEYGVFKARRYPSAIEIKPDDWALAHTIREGETIEDEQLEIDAFDGQK